MNEKTEAGMVRERVERALDECRPFLHQDGGDIELIEIREGGIAVLKYHGTCAICPMSPMTLRAGLERAVLSAVPEIKRVEAVTR
jgi:Fe-S cluster biogenesis protein NfuA